jgi:hypothetical protein
MLWSYYMIPGRGVMKTDYNKLFFNETKGTGFHQQG